MQQQQDASLVADQEVANVGCRLCGCFQQQTVAADANGDTCRPCRLEGLGRAHSLPLQEEALSSALNSPQVSEVIGGVGGSGLVTSQSIPAFISHFIAA